MPGFSVNAFGDSAGPGVSPVTKHKYTWDLVNILGSMVFEASDVRSPLVFAKEVTLPAWMVESQNVPGASLQYKFAKSVSFDDVRISWYDTNGLIDIIRAWRRSVWSPEGGIGYPNAYKKNSSIYHYHMDIDGGTAWLLIGSWPRSIKYGSLTYSDSEVNVVDVTLTYDWAEERPLVKVA